jgi:hypothetical protein
VSTYGHAPNLTAQPGNWYCPKCGIVPDATVYKVLSPVDVVHNHRVIGPYGMETGTRHTVTKYDPWRRT